MLIKQLKTVYAAKRFYTCITYMEKIIEQPRKIKKAQLLPNDTMMVTWWDGLRRIYNLNELESNYSPWNRMTFQTNNVPYVDYEKLDQLESNIEEYGFCALKNVPEEKEGLSYLLGKVQSFAANTLQAHISENYKETFKLVDGLWVTDILKSRYPDSFHILSTVGKNIRNLPIIQKSSNGYNIYYDRHAIPTMLSTIDENMVEAVSDALKNWQCILEDRRNCLHFSLPMGQILFVKTNRILFV